MTKKAIRRLIAALFLIFAIISVSIPTDETEAAGSNSSDFQLNGNTLIKYTGTDKTVSVPSGVEKISESCFSDNANIESVKLPDSLTEIAYSAFSGCNNLKSVTIPDSVTKIGSAAFCDCSNLASVSLGSGLKELGTGIFINCNNITTFSISDKNTHFLYEDGVIYDDEKTQIIEVLPTRKEGAYSMPATVTEIYPYAFYGCKNISDIDVSSNLKEISAYAFSYCYGLKTAKIPYSVTLIDMKAFENCVNLTDVTIPESVSYIHETAFDGCPKLNIIAPEMSYASNWFKNYDNSDVAVIDNEDNSDVTKDEADDTTDDTETVTTTSVDIEGLLGESTVANRRAVVFIDNTKQSVVNEQAQLVDGDDNVVFDINSAINTDSKGKGINIPKFTIIDNTISGKAFYGDTSLTSYDIGDDITSLGDFSFARTGLTSIDIPSSVTYIGYGAFYHCDSLSKIVVPASVTEIEPAAFDKTRMMDNWTQYGESNFLIMGNGILVAYKGTGPSVSIPDTVKQIGAEAFKNHSEITDVNIPDSVTVIREDAFNGCSSLKNVTGGMNVETIEDRAFAGCPLENIRIVDTVKSLGLRAYDYTETSADDSIKVAVFQGESLPTVSYTKTSTRLSNDSYRGDSLKGVKVAIVDNESIDRSGTVLDRGLSGFSGLICVIDDPKTDYANGTLKIIDSTLTEEEASEFSVPSTVYIYGKGYNFNENELTSVLNMSEEGDFSSDESLENQEDYVSFAGSDNKYILDILKSTDNETELKEAYKRIYGDTVPANFTSYEIKVTDAETGIHISKFGKQTLEVTMGLPNNMPSTNLHIICTDENKQLEDLPYTMVTANGKLGVTFEISHTGNYAIYSFNSTAVSSYDLDDSPDTGDYIHPKWFLGLGFLLISLALFIYKPKNQTILKKTL